MRFTTSFRPKPPIRITTIYKRAVGPKPHSICTRTDLVRRRGGRPTTFSPPSTLLLELNLGFGYMCNRIHAFEGRNLIEFAIVSPAQSCENII
ncbi:MAG: hypothetical protein AUI36_19075 [Cyanobacteria bacterium 13_1_40CM_2_61_4]|nr:MAG: hypothetical protein AUI36_19075 [Cyanobacteria bacterium 13_1_40CM_2_61_4]